MKGPPSIVEMRILTRGKEPRAQRFLWTAYTVGAGKQLEYYDQDNKTTVIYCVGPGFGVPLPVRWISEGPMGCVQWYPGETNLQQIWTQQACRAALAVWLAMRRTLKLDTSLCKHVAWMVAVTYEDKVWEAARET